jgi:hypothetical protein
MLVVWTAEGSAARLVAELPVDSVTGVRVHLSESVVVQRCDVRSGRYDGSTPKAVLWVTQGARDVVLSPFASCFLLVGRFLLAITAQINIPHGRKVGYPDS